MDWRADFYGAKYHLDVAKRMLRVYEEYSEKRVLVGIIREVAKSASKLVRAILIFDGTRGNLETFAKKVAPKYLDVKTIANIVTILEIERAEKLSKVEFARKDEILLEDDGKWRILRASRLAELVSSVGDAIGNFPTDIKR